MSTDDFPTFQTAPLVCPECDTEHDAATSVSGIRAPREGSCVICIDCATPAMVEDGKLRRPTDAELVCLNSNKAYLAGVKAVLEFKAHQAGGS